MGTQRTSNKDVLAAIEALTAAIQATVVAPAAIAATPAPNSGEATVNVDAAYLAHMKVKVQDFANSKGEDAILYARKNGRGETKLAYCLASAWANKRDRGIVGPVAHITAS